jgi:general secretion pathway protein I
MRAKDLKNSLLACARMKRYFINPRTSNIAFGLACKAVPLRSNLAQVNRVAGFTLLEVMVALAIFATAAVALTKVGMQYTQSTAHAILRTKAQFVALNEISMMEINRDWLQGTASKQITQQGETWQIDKSAQATISTNVQRVNVQVSLVNTETGKADSGLGNIII